MNYFSALLTAFLAQFNLIFPAPVFNKPAIFIPSPTPEIVRTTIPTPAPKIDITVRLVATPVLTKPEPTIKPSPTLQAPSEPAVRPTSIPIPTVVPTSKPTIAFVPTVKPTTPPPPPSAPASTSVREYIMQEINNYRRSQGLSEVRTDPYTCSFATTRASEITSGFNHDGFTGRINSKTLPYPSYSSVTENLAKISNYKDVVNLWINSSGHAANMRKDTPYVCVEQNGSFFAYEGWKP